MVDVRIVVNTVAVAVFNFGIIVVFSITGIVEDMAVVKMLVVTLLSAVVEVFSNFGHTSLA
jgi:hypothetical protein